ncbi:CpsD/CapB family tyrosine-protein kinase [Robertmurraya andreesenii]|uniref:non-specific protein-tyrosine kinase n=1 Tax=Anoxybacillus andreesenii TaxID=1325932 RepID=A0ABT9UZW4_9BACL|nr:CpsD/CapB family tyrosine-protein kinase [Robertmurraya andreesenii]MDQ0154202.1 capsular exopolysaccharide synthesis family protein [Robertmurraya andreesenii]
MFKKREKKLGTNSRQLITKQNPRSPISEQYRTIRTNIEYSSFDEEIRSIVVTSSGPGEGKSTTISNLAVVFSQQGKKVLLIDADMRKPTAHYTFHMKNNFGLTNILKKQRTLSETVQKSEDNLYILTSGPIPPNPAEILGSKGMEELLREANEQFDLVLIDTPPVLAVTDAQILSNKCSGTILVVNSGKTETEAAMKAKELLVNSKARILGVVLNQKKAKQSQYYYYYGDK